MNVKVESYYFEDSRESFLAEGRVNEDLLNVKDEIFTVFDGVTMLHQKPYPNPSPAKKAAELGSLEIIDHIGKNYGDENGIKVIKKAFEHANKKIKEYNDSLGLTESTVDFLSKQYASTTCSYGYIKDETLYFGQLNDSGVMVFDAERNKEVDFVYNSTLYVQLITQLESAGEFLPGSPEEHVFVRSNVVNNPDLEIENKKVNFGVLDGRENAKKFLHYGSSHLFSGQIILFYTDGFIPFVYDKEFIDLLFETEDRTIVEQHIADKNILGDKYKKNKSLIVVRVK